MRINPGDLTPFTGGSNSLLNETMQLASKEIIDVVNNTSALEQVGHFWGKIVEVIASSI